MDAKLKQLGVPKSSRVEFLRDVFGNPAELEEGLVDVNSDELFEATVKSLEKVWNEREKPFNGNPQFFDWFVKYCKIVVKNSMLKPHRIAAGLGNPPHPYYTNDVESMNKVLKHHTKCKVQELPQFIESMKKIMNDQKKEIERAIIGMGEYRVASAFKYLSINSTLFFQKTSKQRERVVNLFLMRI